MHSDSFSFSRVGRLILMDARFWTRPLLLGGAGVALGVLLLSCIAAFAGGSGHIHASLYGWILGLGGLVFTSRIFLELRHPLTTQGFLLIPASMEEKFVSRYLVSSLGYLIFSFLGYQLLQLLCEGFNSLVAGRTNPLFFPDSLRHLQILAAYLAFQTLFFAGAVYYRKYSLIKTWLSVSALFLLLGLLGYLLVHLFFNGYFDGTQPKKSVIFALAQMGVTGDLYVAFYPLKLWADWVLRIFFWGVMPLCALAFAYFRLRETEV